jgi:hypothetical protein
MIWNILFLIQLYQTLLIYLYLKWIILVGMQLIHVAMGNLHMDL